MPRSEKQRQKGFFSDVRLPVARSYVYPRSRRAMLLAGGTGAVLLLGLMAFDMVAGGGRLASNGPLSSNHAVFETDCGTCHTAFGGIANDRCATCHEKYGDAVGTYSFTSHYLYRTGDFTRVVPAPDEPTCATCHTEHVGRTAAITQVDDFHCQGCHAFSFARGHPEFAAVGAQDPSGLIFPHTLHVNQVKLIRQLADVEQACLACHTPDADGTGFQPLDFEAACAGCHLTAGAATPWLDAAAGNAPGVLPLDALRRDGGPGARWTRDANPAAFERQGGQVRKRPVEHADPWVLDNLRRIRRILYPTAELADLLRASADVPPADARALYAEALATLRDYADGLRAAADPEIQRERVQVDHLIATAEQRVSDPLAPLDETQFLVSAGQLNPQLAPGQVQAYEGLADALTQPCQECHTVERATLGRTQADQAAFHRAAFDHRAHIIHRRCLDCHNAIPIQEFAATGQFAPADVDHSGIQNLPGIASCQTCHAPGKAADACLTCHAFHPDQSQHANLLLYRD